MKKFLCTMLFMLIGSWVFSQERIAVFPFEDMDNVFTRNEAVFFYREFSNEFTNRSSRKFSIVPRQEVERLINTEAAFQLSDFSAREKTAEMQRVLNGTQILSGVIGKVGNRLTISVSLYTYPELVQQPGGATLRVANVDELFDKIPELVKRMQNEIAANQPKATKTVKPPKQSNADLAKFGKKIGYGLLNPLFGLGSYIQGDPLAGGLPLSIAYVISGTLFLVELNAFDYWADGAGVCGTIGLGIAAPALLYGFIRPFIFAKNNRWAQVLDGFHMSVIPTAANDTDISIMYSFKF